MSLAVCIQGTEGAERMRVFSETSGLAVMELGFDPRESGCRAGNLGPPELPAPSACAARAQLPTCGLSAAHISFHSKLIFSCHPIQLIIGKGAQGLRTNPNIK